MPMYDFKCECGDTFVRFAKVDDRDLPCSLPCPSCNTIGTVVRVITATAFTLRENPKISNNFSDRLKEVKENIPPSLTGNLDRHIK